MRHAILAAALLFAGPAHALTAKGLHDNCVDNGDIASLRHVECMSYINGVLDDLTVGVGSDTPSLPRICQPDTNLGTITDIFIAWGDRYPQYLDRNASLGVVASLVEAYPCK